MHRFHVASSFAGTPQALSTTNKSILSGVAQSGSLRRGKLTEFHIGPLTDPVATDCNIVWEIWRQSVNDGTGTSVTPEVYERYEAGTQPAPGSIWLANYTANPTFANSLWGISINQHSGFIWYAPDDIGIPWPAVANNGLACSAKGASASYTGTALWDVVFAE